MTDRSSCDEVLLEAMKNGDAASFNILFDRYWQILYTTVFNISKDSEASSDVVHDIFLNLWLKRDRVKILCFKGYITASARYHVYRYLKSAKRKAIEYRSDLEIHGNSAVNMGESNIRFREFKRKVEWHMEGLPKRCKEIFTLSRMDELSNDEIAQRLDISKRTVENQLTHALHHLRISLKGISLFLIILLFSFHGLYP